MTSEIVSIENLWLFRGEHVILEDINLRLNRADYLGLIGPNGEENRPFSS